jgi:hypothetical protein
LDRFSNPSYTEITLTRFILSNHPVLRAIYQLVLQKMQLVLWSYLREYVVSKFDGAAPAIDAIQTLCGILQHYMNEQLAKTKLFIKT